jgi:hypothetical protein
MSEFTSTILGIMQLFPAPSTIPAFVVVMAAAVSMSIGIMQCCCGKVGYVYFQITFKITFQILQKKSKNYKPAKKMKKAPKKKIGGKEGVKPSPKKKKKGGKPAAGKGINKAKSPAKQQQKITGIEVPVT